MEKSETVEEYKRKLNVKNNKIQELEEKIIEKDL